MNYWPLAVSLRLPTLITFLWSAEALARTGNLTHGSQFKMMTQYNDQLPTLLGSSPMRKRNLVFVLLKEKSSMHETKQILVATPMRSVTTEQKG